MITTTTLSLTPTSSKNLIATSGALRKLTDTISRSVGLSLLFVVALGGCGPSAEKRALKDFPGLDITAYIRMQKTTYEVEFIIDYDYTQGCFSLPNDAFVTLNGVRLRSGQPGFRARGGSCIGPRFTDEFPLLDIELSQDTFEIVDGDYTFRMSAEDVVVPREAQLDGYQLRIRTPVQAALMPLSEKIDDVLKIAYIPEDQAAKDLLSGGFETVGYETLPDNIVEFKVPETFPLGKGELNFITQRAPLQITDCSGSCAIYVSSGRIANVEILEAPSSDTSSTDATSPTEVRY